MKNSVARLSSFFFRNSGLTSLARMTRPLFQPASFWDLLEHVGTHNSELHFALTNKFTEIRHDSPQSRRAGRIRVQRAEHPNCRVGRAAALHGTPPRSLQKSVNCRSPVGSYILSLTTSLSCKRKYNRSPADYYVSLYPIFCGRRFMAQRRHSLS